MIDPVAFHVGAFSIRWYGLAWMASYLLLMYWPPKHLTSQLAKRWPDLISNCTIASVIGGRLGEFLFYQFDLLYSHPWEVFYIWQGGMSFYGALFAISYVIYHEAKTQKLSFWLVTDACVMNVPIALALVRCANFINGELWGRPTNQQWGIRFDRTDMLLRHPSQLYEAFFEGILLWCILRFLQQYKLKQGTLTAIFFLCYGIFRLAIETWYREPSYEWTTLLSTSQILTCVMIMCGLVMMAWQQKVE